MTLIPEFLYGKEKKCWDYREGVFYTIRVNSDHPPQFLGFFKVGASVNGDYLELMYIAYNIIPHPILDIFRLGKAKMRQETFSKTTPVP